MTDSSHKTCTECGATQKPEAFSKSPTSRDGRRGKCRSCVKEEDAVRYRDEVQETLFLRRYGITLDDYAQMLKRQGGKCALCATDTPSGRWGRFVVDHCHTTGRVRGLLCNSCNVALGRLGDSPESIQRALAYVVGQATPTP